MQSGLSLFGDCKERPGSVLVWIGSLSRGSMKWALEDWVRVLAGSLRCRGSFPAVAVSDPGRGPEYCRCTWMGGARGHPSVPSLSQGGSHWVAQQAVCYSPAGSSPTSRPPALLPAGAVPVALELSVHSSRPASPLLPGGFTTSSLPDVPGGKTSPGLRLSLPANWRTSSELSTCFSPSKYLPLPFKFSFAKKGSIFLLSCLLTSS